MKKYDYFNLVAECGAVDETFEKYSDAFTAYQKSDAPKTLYGIDVEDGMSVIFSK